MIYPDQLIQLERQHSTYSILPKISCSWIFCHLVKFSIAIALVHFIPIRYIEAPVRIWYVIQCQLWFLTHCVNIVQHYERGEIEKKVAQKREEIWGNNFTSSVFVQRYWSMWPPCLKSLVKIILHFNLTSNKFLLLDWDQTQCHLKKIKWKFREGKDNLKVWHWRQTSAFSPDNIVLFHYFQSIDQVIIWPSLSWSIL